MIPTLLISGLACASDLFALQPAALWPEGAVMVASTLEGVTMAEIASDILAQAPPRFALAGLSMGGYISLETASPRAGGETGAPRHLRSLRCA